MSAKPATVIIADDHHLVVHSLTLLLEQTLGLTCVATVHDGVSCIKSVLKYIPDLVVLDLDLPGMRGEDVIHQLQKVSAESRILVVTGKTSARVLRKVWESGVHGIVLKGSTVDEICTAVSTVLSGQYFLPSNVSDIINKKSVSDHRLDTLTKRESEVFELLLKRLSVTAIATVLHVSPKTVDNHKTRIMKKLDVHSRAELVAFAVRVGVQDLILNASAE